MKRILFVLTLFLFAQPTFSQEIQWWNPEDGDFSVVQGQGWQEGLQHFYDRLPAKMEHKVRKPVWRLSQEAAGLNIRFRTKATDIYVRYTVGRKLNMPHMPTTGVSGVDLYAIDEDGNWQWSGQWSGGFHFGDTIKYHYTHLPDKYVKEYRLYLPLYNNVKWLEIGVPNGSKLTWLPINPDKPIVVYGTSIAQGACASRPGMAWTAILGRRMHRSVINLGFSGNGLLEKPIIDLLKELNPEMYVLDCLPNMTRFPDDTIERRLTSAVRELRKAKPDIPVLIVEDPHAPMESLDKKIDNQSERVNEVAEKVFTKLKASGMESIYLLTAEDIGFGIESTVAGLHPNDYGMMQYADAYEKIIIKILNQPKGKYSTTQPLKQYRDKSYDWNARHRKELALIRKNPPEVVFIGNSITHFWGGLPEGPRRSGADSWAKYFKAYHIQNLGYGWDRIENVLYRVYHGELDGYEAKQVLINIGTNNLAFNSDKEIVAGMKLLIGAVKERQPDAKILVFGIYPRKGGEQRIVKLNQKIVRLCGMENVNYTDPGVKLLKDNGKIDTSLFIDGRLHPNAKGYRILGTAIAPYLE